MSQPVEQDKQWDDLRHLFATPPPPLGVPFAEEPKTVNLNKVVTAACSGEEPDGQTVNISKIVTEACSRFGASLKESVAAFHSENMQQVKGAVLKIISEQYACNEEKLAKVVHNACSQQTTNLDGLKDIISEAWVVTFDKLNKRGAFQRENLEEVKDAVLKIISQQYACNEEKLAKVVHNACSQQTTNLAALKEIVAEAWVLTLDRLKESGFEERLNDIVKRACASAFLEAKSTLEATCLQEEKVATRLMRTAVSEFMEQITVMKEEVIESNHNLLKEVIESNNNLLKEVIESNNNLSNQLKECTSELRSCAQEINKVKVEIVDDLLKAEKSVIMNDAEESPQEASSFKSRAQPVSKHVTWASDQLPIPQERKGLSLRPKGGSQNSKRLEDEIEAMLGDNGSPNNSADEGPYSPSEEDGRSASTKKSAAGLKKEHQYKRIVNNNQIESSPSPKKKQKTVTAGSLSLRGRNKSSPRTTRSRNNASNSRKQGPLDEASDQSSEEEAMQTRSAASAKPPAFYVPGDRNNCS